MLVFDFLLGTGEGWIRSKRCAMRTQVLDFINANFDLLGKGKLDAAKGVDLTFARKR